MRVACIYWPTSSVGGIATHVATMKREALRRGDTFDIILSASHITKGQELFSEPKTVRGGDTFITIDGYASHHPKRIKDTIKWLEKNYDVLYFGFLCPHPTKAYPEPYFMPLFTKCKLPKVGRISDAYFKTYESWGTKAVKKLDRLLCVQRAYALPLIEKGFDVKISVQPFDPLFKPMSVPKMKSPLLSWTSQWKDIKGIKKVLNVIPDFPKKWKVNMYSNGIRYYQLRTEEAWISAIKKDHFKEFNGKGRANFYGYQPLDVIATALMKSWATINLQGHSAKYEAYKQGAYNNTEVESLYYGAMPILHKQAELSAIPNELFVSVEYAEEIPYALKHIAPDTKRHKKAIKWVMDTHHVSIVYDDSFGGIL